MRGADQMTSFLRKLSSFRPISLWRAAGAALAIGAAVTGVAFASGADKHPHAHAWTWNKPFGAQFERDALQRGFQVYKAICANCHSMDMLSYRNLGEKGGPLQAVAPLKWQEKGVTPEIGAEGHGHYLVNPIDNPFVKAVAAEYTVSELDTNSGEMVERPARPSDKFHRPFANEGLAKAANGGAYPPDLSVIIKARHGGADYVYALLTGYGEAPPAGVDVVDGKSWNPYFSGGWIAMADQLGPAAEAGAVTYADGTKATKEQMAHDVVTFLTWASDPKLEMRKALGFQVMTYLLVLTGLLYAVYRRVWVGQMH